MLMKLLQAFRYIILLKLYYFIIGHEISVDVINFTNSFQFNNFKTSSILQRSFQVDDDPLIYSNNTEIINKWAEK